MSSQMQTSLVNPNFEIDKVPSIGPGDADIFSHDGRNTKVTITTGPIIIASGGSFLEFSLQYRIEEMQPDFTTLEWRDNVKLFAPEGTTIIQAGSGTQPVHYEQIFPGRDHNWHDQRP